MLQLKNLLKAALKSLLKNRMRSLLTSLGIIIGVSAVIVMSAIGQGSQALIEQEIDALGANLLLDEGDEDDFDIHNQTEITETVTRTSKVMTMLLGSIASVSLVVGGIGIMNIMLVSVTERTREIGIRLSVGARSSDVLVQFLAEAVVLSLLGGILGILLAFAISFALNEFTAYYPLIQLKIIVIAGMFSGAVGVFFGFYPARKAAALNPIDALRYE